MTRFALAAAAAAGVLLSADTARAQPANTRGVVPTYGFVRPAAAPVGVNAGLNGIRNTGINPYNAGAYDRSPYTAGAAASPYTNFTPMVYSGANYYNPTTWSGPVNTAGVGTRGFNPIGYGPALNSGGFNYGGFNNPLVPNYNVGRYGGYRP